MFAKLRIVHLLPLASLLALLLPLISALTFKTPTDVVSGNESTFTWILDGHEPNAYYILLRGPSSQLLGPVSDPEQTSITAVPYVVPANGYVLVAAFGPYGDQIFARSDTFPVNNPE
ncbi:hypothetical protein J3R83DRAFT_1386 [Lanmaoa asiatica]|nr:hypothetical protein J3R83DRAFT_1386 [Lanmaoa asiatica]